MTERQLPRIVRLARAIFTIRHHETKRKTLSEDIIRAEHEFNSLGQSGLHVIPELIERMKNLVKEYAELATWYTIEEEREERD